MKIFYAQTKKTPWLGTSANWPIIPKTIQSNKNDLGLQEEPERPVMDTGPNSYNPFTNSARHPRQNYTMYPPFISTDRSNVPSNVGSQTSDPMGLSRHTFNPGNRGQAQQSRGTKKSTKHKEAQGPLQRQVSGTYSSLQRSFHSQDSGNRYEGQDNDSTAGFNDPFDLPGISTSFTILTQDIPKQRVMGREGIREDISATFASMRIMQKITELDISHGMSDGGPRWNTGDDVVVQIEQLQWEEEEKPGKPQTKVPRGQENMEGSKALLDKRPYEDVPNDTWNPQKFPRSSE